MFLFSGTILVMPELESLSSTREALAFFMSFRLSVLILLFSSVRCAMFLHEAKALQLKRVSLLFAKLRVCKLFRLLK